jgi:DNA-3-methyladenine glycosylase II
MSQPALDHLSKADKVMARLIRRIGPCAWKPDRRRSPFESLVKAVTYQQLNGIAAKTILGRVKALYPGKSFPTPEDLLATTDEALRAAGLSRAKVAAIKDIAAKTLAGVVPTSRAIARMENELIISRLTTIRGVGIWTVEMLLMFKLGRTDVLPATDFGVRKGFAVTYELDDLPHPKELLAHGEKWRPYRSYAAWYLWRALDAPA